MANWEFLLQKKGDRRWGTAHKPTLKLKAGSYRIAAQGQPNAEVHIEIIYETQDDQGNPLRRSQNRIKATNHKGLMAIMPFTQFKPGLWQIVCRSLEVASPWEYSLCLDILPVPQAKPPVFRPLPLPPNPNLFSFEGSISLPETPPSDVESEETILDRSLAKLMAARADRQTSETLREIVESTLKDLDQPETTLEEDLDEWEMVDETASGLLQSSLLELEELLKEELEPIWQEMEQSAQQAENASREPIRVTPPVIGIRLNQSVYTWQGTQPVEIQGRLTAIAPISAADIDHWQHLRLQFTLFNPQNSEKLVFVEQEIAQFTDSYSFRQAFLIDPQWRTLAIVGEIVLLQPGQPPKILAAQALNLIADYQAIAAQIHLPEIPEEEEALLERHSKRDLIDLPTPAPPPAESVIRQPERRSPSILPPKLSTPSKTPHSPQLPTFRQSGTSAPPAEQPIEQVGEAQLESAVIPALPGGDAPLDLPERQPTAALDADEIPYPFVLAPDEIPYPFVLTPEELEPAPPLDVPVAPEAEAPEAEDTTATTTASEIPTFVEAPTETDLEPPTSPDTTPASESSATETTDLDWNARFLSRLNALAADNGAATWLQEPPETVIFQHNVIVPDTPLLNPFENVDRDLERAAIELDLTMTAAIAEETITDATTVADNGETETYPVTMEIVVDDWEEAEAAIEPTEPAPVEPIYDASGLPYPQSVLTEDSVPEAMIALTQPVPEPELQLSKAEYQAEDMAVVRIILPPYPDRVYVKLWLQDRQSRVILVGPHQLTDFSQDEAGNRETLVQILIPPGAIEVRFEAIAINPRLQQESRKVGVDRHVVPKDFAAINWDDLDV